MSTIRTILRGTQSLGLALNTFRFFYNYRTLLSSFHNYVITPLDNNLNQNIAKTCKIICLLGCIGISAYLLIKHKKAAFGLVALSSALTTLYRPPNNIYTYFNNIFVNITMAGIITGPISSKEEETRIADSFTYFACVMTALSPSNTHFVSYPLIASRSIYDYFNNTNFLESIWRNYLNCMTIISKYLKTKFLSSSSQANNIQNSPNSTISNSAVSNLGFIGQFTNLIRRNPNTQNIDR